MSFGGGRDSYTLEYIIKVVNQGGTSGTTQISTGLNQVDTGIRKVTASQQQLTSAHERVIQAQQGVTKAMKGMAFGMLGIVTAGAEFGGMLSMYRQVQAAQKEAVDEQTRALKESGKESKDYKDATMEVVKVNRWASMTFRNLMLSTFDMLPFIILTINGMHKLKTAMAALKEARAAEASLRALGIATKGMGAEAVIATAAQAKLMKGTTASVGAVKTFTAAQAASNIQTVASTGAFSNKTVALGTATAATNLQTAATGRLSKAMRVLTIAAKILVPLIAIELGAQAFARNWGGFRDSINEVGVAIGNTIPQLKGMLGYIDKIGRSVVAIFTGDFDSIGSIWNPVVKGGEKAAEISESARKKLEELEQALNDVSVAGLDALTEISRIEKKGERRDALKAMGFTGDGVKTMDKWLKKLNEVQTGLDGFEKGIESMRTLNILQKYGLDVPNETWKNMAKGFSKIFDSMGDEFPGDDIFDQFSEVLKKASEKKGPVVMTDIFEFMAKNPNFMPMLAELRPELYAKLKAMMKGAGPSMQEGLNTGIKNAFSTGDILKIDKGDNVATSFDWSTGKAGDYKKSGGSGGIFQGIIDSIKTGVAGIATAIKEADWKAIGEALRTKLEEVITVENAKKIGQLIRIYIVDPAYAAAYPIGSMIGQAIKDGWEAFKKAPVESTLGTTNVIGEPMANFVVGLLGYNSEQDMFTDWDNQLRKIFSNNPALLQIRRIINDPVGGIIAFLKGEGGTKSRFDTEPGSGQVSIGTILNKNKNLGQVIAETFDREIIQPLTTAYNNFTTNPIVSKIGGIISDPIGYIIETLNNSKPQSRFKGATSPSDAVRKRSGDSDISIWFTTNLITPITNAVDTAKTTLISWYNGLEQVGKTIVDFFRGVASKLDIFNALVNEAEASPGDITTTTNQDAIDITITATDNNSAANIRKVFGSALQDIYDTMQDLLNQWSDICADIAQNAKDACEGIRDEFGSALQDVYDTMVDLANQWSEQGANMIETAESVAKGINKELDSIEDEEVIIDYKETGAVPGKAKGGLLSMAEGGIMSAASGRLLTTYGPQLFKIGDNPGGRESIWAIPHNNPGPTVAKIDRMYKPHGGSGGGTTVMNGNFNFNISGNDIINDVKINRRIRTVIGENMDRFG